MNSDWFNLTAGSASIIGLVLAVAALLLGFYFFTRSNNLKSLAYTYKTVQFIDDIPGDKRLRLTFDGQEINKVSLTKIAVWNNSNNVIEESDFAPKKHLTITSEEPDLILDAYKLHDGEKSNNLSFLRSKNSIRLLFDYFGPDEGFIVSVLHQGSLETDFSVKGIFKNKKQHKIKYIKLLGEDILGNFSRHDYGASFLNFFLPLSFLILKKLYRILKTRPSWLDIYRSDDWSIGEENIIDWVE